jgi:hypothetical protein
MEINTLHINDVPIEKWQEVCTQLKINLAGAMQDLQDQKNRLKDNKDLSEDEKYRIHFDLFIEQGKLGTFLQELIFFYRNEEEKKFNLSSKNNINVLNETLDEIKEEK